MSRFWSSSYWNTYTDTDVEDSHFWFGLIADTDDDNYRPSKRSRADLRPPPQAAPRSYDDMDGMQSSPGRSQRGDFPTTDQTDDEHFEVSLHDYFTSAKLNLTMILILIFLSHLHFWCLLFIRMKMMRRASLRCIVFREHLESGLLETKFVVL